MYQLMKRNNLDGYQGHYAEWKMSISKCPILSDSIYITVFKRQNYRDGEPVIGGLVMVWGGGGVTPKGQYEGDCGDWVLYI